MATTSTTRSVLLIFTISFAVSLAACGPRDGAVDKQPIVLTTNESALEAASLDFGLDVQIKPKAVLYPASVEDIAKLIKSANEGDGFEVSARGRGHSVNGQTMTSTGVVVDMSRTYNKILNDTDEFRPKVNVEGKFVDVWGGELWIDVLLATLKQGLAPKTWTDYLYLTVGGTLSNAGMSGHAYNHGPQISNVDELQVVTGKGDIVTCSRQVNSDLFYGTLGGLGQFGIITRARIPLEPAPERVKYIIIPYTDFEKFTKDEECLVSLHDKPSKFDYVGGFVTYNHSVPDGSSPVVYNLEAVKNYGKSTANIIDQEVEALLKKLDYTPNSESRKDMTYVDFLDRIHTNELGLRAQGLWVVPHPYINFFIPSSKMAEFDQAVFKGILRNNTNPGNILIYALNKNKWEDGTSAVIPDADVFYAVSFLWSATNSTSEEPHSLKYLKKLNDQIVEYLKEAQTGAKEYIPVYTSIDDWKTHYGPEKWEQINKRKSKYDPKHILATGQHIFNPPSLVAGQGLADHSWVI